MVAMNDWIEAPVDIDPLGIRKGERINIGNVSEFPDASANCPRCCNPSVTKIREAEHCQSGRKLKLYTCASCAGVVYVALEQSARLDDEWVAVA